MSVAQLLLGNNVEILRTMPDNMFDSIVTDPPYGLSFMGKKWDYDVPSEAIWRECLRVLKPGGHLLAFAGTRTQHRMAVRIEDAGFEIRDMIAWVYSSGFPKSLNVAKAIESGGGRPEDIRRMQMGEDYAPSGRGRVNYDHGAGSAMDAGATDWSPDTEAAAKWQGFGTALKPALEPITVARKPLIGTVADNVLAHGTGALNIDGCRVDAPDGVPLFSSRAEANGSNRTGEVGTGRWPANLIHDGSDEVVALFPESAGQQGDVRGTEKSRTGAEGTNCYGEFGRIPSAKRGDAGSAARFFYCAKASRSDRGTGNNHPTVKPTELMRYLCRLVTPIGGLVLDPFVGSGTTGIAASLEGFMSIGIEREESYAAIIKSRFAERNLPLLY